MALLLCKLYGKFVFRQKDTRSKGYCFTSYLPVVGYEDCLKCKDPECDLGYNLKPLLRNKELRKKVLDYAYDATLDDILLLEGIIPYRTLSLGLGSKKKGKIYSKPEYGEKEGKDMLALDELRLKSAQKQRHYKNSLQAVIENAKPLKPRVIKENSKQIESISNNPHP